MKKTRQAHLWIGLICSIFILMESITGLIMNEPWLIGQAQTEGGGNFKQGMMMPPQQSQSTTTTDSNQSTGQTSQSGTASQSGTTAQSGTTSQSNSNTTNGQAPAFGGRGSIGGEGSQSGSFMGIIRGLHEGKIGSTDITWLIDLTAIAMIFLTGSGIFLSIKVLKADRKRKKLKKERAIA